MREKRVGGQEERNEIKRSVREMTLVIAFTAYTFTAKALKRLSRKRLRIPF